MEKYEYDANIAYLEEKGLSQVGCPWPDKPCSVELETYTDAGEDMIIDLEEPTRESLQKYIDDFDINEEVMNWWREGEDFAHSKGVPFNNIRDHYNDYEAYLENLRTICNGMPY